MTDVYALRYRLIKRNLSLDWLIEQFRHRRLSHSAREIQDVYCGVISGKEAASVISKSMGILDDYDVWYNTITA